MMTMMLLFLRLLQLLLMLMFFVHKQRHGARSMLGSSIYCHSRHCVALRGAWALRCLGPWHAAISAVPPPCVITSTSSAARPQRLGRRTRGAAGVLAAYRFLLCMLLSQGTASIANKRSQLSQHCFGWASIRITSVLPLPGACRRRSRNSPCNRSKAESHLEDNSTVQDANGGAAASSTDSIESKSLLEPTGHKTNRVCSIEFHRPDLFRSRELGLHPMF